MILLFGRQILSVFNSDPDVVAIGYTRLMLVMLAHSFSLLCNVMSGYMRGFGISLVPALLTTCGVCGIRLAWIRFVFPTSPTFRTIMTVYPISLGVTAILILTAFKTSIFLSLHLRRRTGCSGKSFSARRRSPFHKDSLLQRYTEGCFYIFIFSVRPASAYPRHSP